MFKYTAPKFPITTQKEIRSKFWQLHPTLSNKKRKTGDYPTDTRCAFCDFIDHLQRGGQISSALAARVTL